MHCTSFEGSVHACKRPVLHSSSFEQCFSWFASFSPFQRASIMYCLLLVWATIFQSLHIHISYSMHIFHISIRFTNVAFTTFLKLDVQKTCKPHNFDNSRPLLELVFQAATVHRSGFFDAQEVQQSRLVFPISQLPTQVGMRNDVK